MKKLLLCLVFLNTNLFSQHLSLLNFEEIFASLQVSLNVPATPELQKKYEAVRDFLPRHGLIEEYTAPMQLGFIRLLGEMCQIRVQRDKNLPDKERFLHEGIHFNHTSGSVPVFQQKQLIERYFKAFFQRLPSPKEEALALASFSEMSAKTSEIEKFLTLFCVGIGSGIDLLVL